MPHPVRSRHAFAALSTSGDRTRAGSLWVVHAVVDDPEHAGRVEVAFAIGRAVGTAVVRNRLRRRLRVLMDEVVDEGLAPGCYLIGTRPAAAEHTFDELRALVQRVVAPWRTESPS